MRYADLKVGDLISINGHASCVLNITPDGDITVEINGEPVTRRPNPNHAVTIVGHNDGLAELAGIATRCGTTLNQAQQLVTQIYLGAVLLGDENPDGTHTCPPWEAMTAREQEAHMIYFHHGDEQHTETHDNTHTHTH